MKNILFLLQFQFLFFAANAQWTQQTSGTTKGLYCVCFNGQKEGVIVGESGTLLKTTDGVQWKAKGSGTANHLLSVHFPSLYVGYAVGDQGTIIKTGDGGNSWTVQTSGVNSLLNGVWFVSDSTGYAVGNDSIILKTTNGGSTWSLSNKGTNANQDILSVQFVDAKTGYASISENPYHGVLKTTDGGATWANDTLGGSSIAYSIFFTSTTEGYAAGSNELIEKTTDGGKHWMSQHSNFGGVFYSLFFTDGNTGYAVGGMGNRIKYTTNAGLNWKEEAVPTTVALLSVHFTKTGIGYIVGQNGTILAKGAVSNGINDRNERNQVSLYPNPASDKLYIQSKESSPVHLAILDMTGRCVLENSKIKPTDNLDISALNEGLYLYKIIVANQQQETGKLVIVR